MSFFKKVLKFASPASYLPAPVRNIVYPAIGAVIGGSVGLPTLGASAAQGLNTYISGGNIGDSLKSAGATYAGSEIGSQLIGDKLGTIGSTIGQSSSNAVGPAYNSTIGNIIGTNAGGYAGNALSSSFAAPLLNSSIGSTLGAYAGNSLVQKADSPSTDGQTSELSSFSPKQEDQQDLPTSLNTLGGLTQDQQSTNLATQGVYGGGNGPQEQGYFENLINRRLVDPSGQTSDLSNLKPIEQSYLQKLGFGGYGDTSSLLEALTKWKQQQAAA